MLNRALLILKNQALLRLNHQSRLFQILRAAYLGFVYFRAEAKKPLHIQRAKIHSRSGLHLPYRGDVTLAAHTTYERTGFQPPFQVSLDIFVPVFNRFDLIKPLLIKLVDQKINIKDTYLNLSIYVGDDFSNLRTSERLKSLCSELGIHYTRREQNLGVVKNVNHGFSASESDFFLLLNSDVSVGDDFVSRMLEPMLYDEKIGATTALTLGEIQKHMKLDAGVNWRLIDSYLGLQAPQVVDACTAISYSILIRRKAIRSSQLMDVAFGIGYGEDSDLHYRILESGYRSVWNLNLVVCHQGGSSFSITTEHQAHQLHGNRLFHSRWGGRYQSEIAQHETVLKATLDEIFSDYLRPEERWVWVISPAIDPKVGGLLVGAVGAKEIIESSPYVSLVDISDHESQLVFDSFVSVNSKTFRDNCKFGDKIILLGLGSIRWWSAHRGMIPKMETYYFLQGPDALIDPTGVADFLEVQSAFDGIITNSDCQSELSKELFPSLSPAQVKITTDDAYFSLPAAELTSKRDIDVLFCLRNEWGKGATIGSALINQLSREANVAIFGSGERNDITGRVLDLGELSHSGLLGVLRRTKVYVDTSIFEGFGLIPREAADSGAQVFILPNTGGLDPLLKFHSHFTPLQKFWNLPASAVQIMEKTKSLPCNGCSYCVREPVASLGSQIISILGLDS